MQFVRDTRPPAHIARMLTSLHPKAALLQVGLDPRWFICLKKNAGDDRVFDNWEVLTPVLTAKKTRSGQVIVNKRGRPVPVPVPSVSAPCLGAVAQARAILEYRKRHRRAVTEMHAAREADKEKARAADMTETLESSRETLRIAKRVFQKRGIDTSSPTVNLDRAGRDEVVRKQDPETWEQRMRDKGYLPNRKERAGMDDDDYRRLRNRVLGKGR